MANRLDDTEDRRPGDRHQDDEAPERRHPEVEAAEFEAEQPARDLTGLLGVGESVQAVKDGALDAFFWSGGVPTSAVTDLATSRELLLLPTDQYVEPLKQRYGEFYISAEIEPGRYEGVGEPVKVVAVPNYLVVHRSMDPELAYRLTKLLFDRKSALAEVHPSAERLELETAPKVAPLELHPGARRYYDEQART